MMRRAYRIFGIPGIFLVCVILLASCASVAIPRQADTEESLRNTASLYWNLRMAGKYKDTLKFEDPKTLAEGDKYRQGLPLDKYYETKAPITGSVMSITVKDVRIKDDKGKADMLFTIQFPELPKPIKQIVADDWVLRDGKWWHFFEW